MTRKPSTATMIKQLRRHRDRIGTERDKLRETLTEFEAMDEDATEAMENIDSAIDALSRLT